MISILIMCFPNLTYKSNLVSYFLREMTTTPKMLHLLQIRNLNGGERLTCLRRQSPSRPQKILCFSPKEANGQFGTASRCPETRNFSHAILECITYSQIELPSPVNYSPETISVQRFIVPCFNLKVIVIFKDAVGRPWHCRWRLLSCRWC